MFLCFSKHLSPCRLQSSWIIKNPGQLFKRLRGGKTRIARSEHRLQQGVAPVAPQLSLYS